MNTTHAMRFATLSLLLCTIVMTCANDPVVHARYRAGQTAEEVLVDLSRQRKHLYIVVLDGPALTHRMMTDMRRDMMSTFVATFGDAARLQASYRPYEPHSPRGTLEVGSPGASRATVYAVISEGRLNVKGASDPRRQ